MTGTATGGRIKKFMARRKSKRSLKKLEVSTTSSLHSVDVETKAPSPKSVSDPILEPAPEPETETPSGTPTEHATESDLAPAALESETETPSGTSTEHATESELSLAEPEFTKETVEQYSDREMEVEETVKLVSEPATESTTEISPAKPESLQETAEQQLDQVLEIDETEKDQKQSWFREKLMCCLGGEEVNKKGLLTAGTL